MGGVYASERNCERPSGTAERTANDEFRMTVRQKGGVDSASFEGLRSSFRRRARRLRLLVTGAFSVRIGIGVGAGAGDENSISSMIKQVQRAEESGFDSVWVANIFGVDAITFLAMAGRETSKIELATGVVPTYPRHPTVMAQQALTAAAASENRFTLGIGLSHKVVIENMMGLDYSKPIRHTREYLSVLIPLLEGEQVRFRGE